MVGFLQRCGYSPRWRLLWYVTHIEVRRAGQMPGRTKYQVRGTGAKPPRYSTIYLGYRGIFVI